MADTVPITAGSGTSIATDDVAGVHYQRVKLVDGTLDSSAAIPGDATNGLDVDVTRLPGTVAADIAAIKAAVEIIDNAIAGAEMQVDVVSGSTSGVEYTEADVDATITGKVVMWEDTSDTLRAASAAKPLPVNIASVTASATGASVFRSLDLDETEEEIKSTAGIVYGMWVTNTATTTRWIKFYNATASTVIVGTTAPIITIGIPGNSSDDVSGVFNAGGPGIAFSTAITVAATTGVADSDVGAPAVNDVIVNITYA